MSEKNCEPVTLVVCGQISRQEAPNFDVSGKKGLHVCWGQYKRQKRTKRASPRVRALVMALIDVWRPYDFTPDGRQIVWSEIYLEEHQA